MNIVFNVNSLGLGGLGATLVSLIRNCSQPELLKLWFLYSDFHEKDRLNINNLLAGEKFLGEVEYINFDSKKIFGHLKPLHGDWTIYGRLLISEYINDDVALYLDSDLIVLLDVFTLINFDFGQNILAAVYGCTIAWTLDKSFFIDKLNYSLEQEYFNSGILLFNLKQWRNLHIDKKWRDIAEEYPDELISHDQTLLNAVCEGNFAHLLPEFNNGWLPSNKEPYNANKSILHFVGSPKPWDIFGRFIHNGYNIWREYSTTSWEKEYNKISFKKIYRTWKIRKSITKHLMNKLLNKQLS